MVSTNAETYHTDWLYHHNNNTPPTFFTLYLWLVYHLPVSRTDRLLRITCLLLYTSYTSLCIESLCVREQLEPIDYFCEALAQALCV